MENAVQSGLVESVARALAGHFGPAFDDLPRDKRALRALYGEEPGLCHQEELLDAARDAIAAMQGPLTEVMLDNMVDDEPEERNAAKYALDLAFAALSPAE